MITLERPIGLSLLSVLLRATGWPGDTARLNEAAPHMTHLLSNMDLLQTLENLGLAAQAVDGIRLPRITGDDCPCLWIPRDGDPYVILDAHESRLLVAHGEDAPIWIDPDRVRGWLVRIEENLESSEPTPDTGVGDILRSFRGTIGLLVGVSLFTGLLGFAAPLLIMVVYDRLIPTRSVDFLVALVVGMAGVLIADIALRIVRGRALAWMGARMERRMGLVLFRKLAMLPMDQIQRVSVDSQIARLKQFESLRGIFTGPLLTTLLEMPFVLVFLAAIWALDADIGLLITGLAVAFTIATAVTVPAQTRLNRRSSAERNSLSALMLEAAVQQRAIQRLGVGAIWTERCETASTRAAAAARNARQLQYFSQVFGQSLMMCAGIGAVVLGTRSAMQGEVSFGALIALIALTWKVLSPIQMLYASGYQIAGYLHSARQVGTFLSMAEERRQGPSRSPFRRFRGAMRIDGVTHRYATLADPALSGVSTAIGEGELVIVCGRNGAGKSTFLKMLGGLHTPISGTLSIDGVDYRQIAVDELRDAIAHIPQSAEFFHGSILQNFQLADPTANEEEVIALLRKMDLGPEIAGLPDGVHTRLSEEVRRTLPTGTLQAMSVARGLMRDKALYLLDEPCSGLDARHEGALLECIRDMRGRRTVVMVTDRPSHFALADRLVFLDHGRVVINDTGPEALRKVRALYSSMRKS